MTAKSTAEVWSEIEGVAKPLESTLKALAENPNGSSPGKEQAGGNAKVMEELRTTGAAIVAQAQATQTQSLGPRMGRGGSSAPDDRDKDK
jgi:hypothetical protein